MYNIISSIINQKDGKITSVFVLVDYTKQDQKPLSDIKGYYATSKPCSGYFFIPPNAEIDSKLLQKVAASGMKMNDLNIFKKLNHDYSLKP